MAAAKLLSVTMYVTVLAIASGETTAARSFFETKRVGSVTDFTERTHPKSMKSDGTPGRPTGSL